MKSPFDAEMVNISLPSALKLTNGVPVMAIWYDWLLGVFTSEKKVVEFSRNLYVSDAPSSLNETLSHASPIVSLPAT